MSQHTQPEPGPAGPSGPRGPSMAELNANRSMLRYSRAVGYADTTRRVEGLAPGDLNELADRQTQTEIQSVAGGPMVVKIIGPIDSLWGFSAPDLIRRIEREQPTSITLILSSPGGYVFEAMALYQDLRAQAREGIPVSTEVRHVASSAAAILALVGDERRIAEGSAMMFHAPYMPFFFLSKMRNNAATQTEIDNVLNALKTTQQQFVSILKNRAGQSEADAEGLMDGADHWFEANEALEAGFVQTIVDGEDSTETSDDDEDGGGAEVEVETVDASDPDSSSISHSEQIDRIIAHHLQREQPHESQHQNV